MTGLYIHIPFCRKRCVYCHFASGWPWNSEKENLYLEALLQEASLYTKVHGKLPIHTLYLGGGTPSLLSSEGLTRLVRQLSKCFSFELHESTLEVNPEDISPKKLSLWKTLGFNRLSLGVQSVQEEILTFLSRPTMNLEYIYDQVMAHQFDYISVDFIVGIPGLDTDKILRWIEKHPSHHLSLYLLSVEQGSILAGLSRLGKFLPIDPDLQINQYLSLAKELSHWYEWYEISNFARHRHCRAMHNSLYWNYEPYIGLGINASSFFPWERKRCRNTSHWTKYLNTIQQGIFPYEETEKIDTSTERLERFMLGLRMSDGVDMHWIHSWNSDATIHHLKEKIKQLAPFCFINKERLILTPEGRMIAHTIITTLWNILEEKATERD